MDKIQVFVCLENNKTQILRLAFENEGQNIITMHCKIQPCIIWVKFVLPWLPEADPHLKLWPFHKRHWWSLYWPLLGLRCRIKQQNKKLKNNVIVKLNTPKATTLYITEYLHPDRQKYTSDISVGRIQSLYMRWSPFDDKIKIWLIIFIAYIPNRNMIIF